MHFPWTTLWVLAHLAPSLAQLPSPGLAFFRKLDDSGAEGIAVQGSDMVLVTANQAWSGDSFTESWVHKLDPTNGSILQSRLIGQDRSKVGACTLLEPSDDGPALLIINPWTGDADFNTGIYAVRTDTMEIVWNSNIVREADRGVPPVISPKGDVVYYSSNAGIAVLDEKGRVQWATTTIRAGQIAVTGGNVYAVDRRPGEQYPLNVYNIVTGALVASSGPQTAASTNAGVVLSPDGLFAYTVRTGTNGGLHKNRANFMFVPPEVITTKISSGKKEWQCWGRVQVLRETDIVPLCYQQPIASVR